MSRSIFSDVRAHIIFSIVLNRAFFFQRKNILISNLSLKIYCGYSLEVPQFGTSNEYAQYIFSWRNKKNYLSDYALIQRYIFTFLKSYIIVD